MSEGQSRIHGPDPTALTTEQLTREAAHLKELFTSLLEAMEKAMVARLTAMDKAVEILQGMADRSPSVNEVYLQHEEKFKSIELQFAERDTRTEQSAAQTKIAIDDALQAAEKAVGKQQEASDRAIAKSEASVTKQIDQLGVIMATSNKASDEKIDDLKGRLSGIDGRDKGIDKGREPLNAIWIILVGTLLAAIVGFIASKLGGTEPLPQSPTNESRQ